MTTNSYGLSEYQIAEFQQLFSTYDPQGKGVILSQDLPAVVKSLGQFWTSTDLQDLIDEVNIEHNGRLDFSNFLNMMTRKVKPGDEGSEEKFREAWKELDEAEKSQEKIKVEELKKMVRGLGENVTEEELDEMIKEVGVDEDGFVSYSEFISVLMRK